jgi:hypothetical protein
MFYSLLMHLRALIADDTLSISSTAFANGTDEILLDPSMAREPM